MHPAQFFLFLALTAVWLSGDDFTGPDSTAIVQEDESDVG
jgi:hypothetical protein